MSSDIIETIRAGEWALKIYHDDGWDNPREWDNLGTMLTWLRNYDSPDKNRFATPDDFMDWWQDEGYAEDDGAHLLPVYMLDHSGVAFSTSDFNDRWDSGQVGWIFATSKDVEGWGAIDVAARLRDEVKIYGQWANGENYGWTITQSRVCSHCGHLDEDVIADCGGFLGSIEVNDIFAGVELERDVEALLREALREAAPYVVSGLS